MQRLVIGDFELIEPLGEGTAGLAYRARHQKTGQAAAVKLLHQDMSQAEEIQRRFVREVAIVQRLDHPNIVRHLDSGLHDDQIFFAMELVDCGTLKEVLQRRQKLPWREAVECAVQICAGLDYAHRQGVVHRDLKPANLFLSDDGKVKIGDFGLARDLQNFRLTIDGQTVGTVRYMPPEQITGEAELTGAVDLYALGCMLYEMLVGHTPFGGNSILAIFEQHLNTVPTQPSALVPDCPPDLSALVMRLLAKKPEERPASAAIVRAALVDILHGRPVRIEGRPTDEVEEEASPSMDDGQPNLTSRLRVGAAIEPRTVVSTKRLLIIGAVIAACALGAYFLYLMR